MISLTDAREKAREGVARIKAGLVRKGDPLLPPPEPEIDPDTMADVVARFLARQVIGKQRTAREVERIFNVYVLPSWRDRRIDSIRRRDVNDLLDQIEDGVLKGPDGRRRGGPVQADRVLGELRKLFNWQATRDDDFISPIVPGMNRTNHLDRARRRVLSDDEICVMWPLLTGTFGAMLKIALLTGARRAKLANMKWQDIGEDGIWTIDTEAREKSTAGALPLSGMAREIIDAQPRIAANAYVFSGRGTGPIRNFSLPKRAIDEAIMTTLREQAEKRGEDPAKVQPLEPWVVHDLRRSAKTLMQRAGTAPNISERVLGHVIPGVEGIYDRHNYEEQIGDALERLAALVADILDPTSPSKVVPLWKRQ